MFTGMHLDRIRGVKLFLWNIGVLKQMRGNPSLQWAAIAGSSRSENWLCSFDQSLQVDLCNLRSITACLPACVQITKITNRIANNTKVKIQEFLAFSHESVSFWKEIRMCARTCCKKGKRSISFIGFKHIVINGNLNPLQKEQTPLKWRLGRVVYNKAAVEFLLFKICSSLCSLD